MRSTDGLRPKIGRITTPAPTPQAATVVSPASDARPAEALKRAPRGLAVQRNRPSASVEPSAVPPAANAASARAGLSRSSLGAAAAKNATVAPASEDDLEWDRVTSILKFLILPAIFALLIVVAGVKMPKIVLFGFAGVVGLAAVIRAQKDPEILLALMLLYMPFAHLYAISIAPMVNGTNVFILLCLFAGIASSKKRGEPAFAAKPGFKLTVAWFVLSSASIFTLVRTPGALSFTLSEELTQYTAWLSQFGFYLAVYSLIKTRGQAKRAMIYLMFGTVIVVAYGARETIDKIGAGSIEKMRIGGVFEQPNDFGGFIAYTFLPFFTLFLFNMGKIKAWLMTPYFFITLKVLITTFSRGAFVAFACSAIVVTWLRGKAFMFGWGLFALIFIALVPSILPQSVFDRFNETGRNSRVQKLDKSSADRLILWNAAIEMTLENPITGKGFKAFPYLKSQYTATPVREADPHNMYLYISSQMGIPTLLVFLAMLLHMAWISVLVFKRSVDPFERVIGVTIAAVVPSIAFTSLFGSRMVGMSFVGYFYTMLVITQVLYSKSAPAKLGAQMGQTSAQSEPDPVAGNSRLGSSKLGVARNNVESSEVAQSETTFTKRLPSRIGRA